MKKVKLKQGTLAWEKVRQSRIGSSEIFDIVRYYSTDEELQNCGINAEDFKSETPFTSVWSLYHKLRNDGLYRKAAIEPENAEYGHATEPYGVKKLQTGRANKLRPGEVYISDRLIASLDISGIAEEIDCVPFCNGSGTPQVGQRFVCEQKSLRPNVIKKSLPYIDAVWCRAGIPWTYDTNIPHESFSVWDDKDGSLYCQAIVFDIADVEGGGSDA